MPYIDSPKYVGSSTGADGGKRRHYFRFEYTNSIKELVCTTNWTLYAIGENLQAETNYNVFRGRLLINDEIVYHTGISSDKTEEGTNGIRCYGSSTVLSSGSFVTNLNENNGLGSFSVELVGSIDYNLSYKNSCIPKQDINISGGWIDIDGSPKLTIQDKGDNTIDFFVTIPEGKLNNTFDKCYLLYTRNGLPLVEGAAQTIVIDIEESMFKNNEATIPQDLLSTSEKVYGCVKFKTTHQTLETQIIEIPVTYYIEPKNPFDVKLEYSGKVPLLKKDLTFVWEPSEPNNDNSPVQGYELVLYKYKNEQKLDEQKLEEIDTKDTTPRFVLTEQIKAQLIKGEYISLEVRGYSVNGVGKKLYSDPSQSQPYQLGSSGTCFIKITSNINEGQVWVKTNKQWVEANGLYVKQNTWKESI